MDLRPRVIAGSGRSGTTWVQDVLAKSNNMRTIFEPLHPQAIATAQSHADRYCCPDSEDPGLEIFFRQIFSGELRSVWSDYRIRPNLLKFRWERISSPGKVYGFYSEWRAAARRYFRFRKELDRPDILVKVIRGNLMLGWLRKKYDARVLFVVRHPGAVVESKVRIGGASWDASHMLEHYRTPGVLGVIAERYEDLLNQDLSPAESHTLLWCIENQLPLEESGAQGIAVAFYESLVADSEREWKRVIEELDLPISPYGSDLIEKPSQQSSSARSKRLRGGGSHWSERLTQLELSGIEAILNATGETHYGAYELMPLHLARN